MENTKENRGQKRGTWPPCLASVTSAEVMTFMVDMMASPTVLPVDPNPNSKLWIMTASLHTPGELITLMFLLSHKLLSIAILALMLLSLSCVSQNVTVSKTRGASRHEDETIFDPMETKDEMVDMVRKTYSETVHEIIQMLCEATVDKFKDSPAIYGIVGPILLSYIVFLDKDWPKEVIQLEEAKTEDRKEEEKERRT